MMRLNRQMQRLLTAQGIDPAAVQPSEDYPIWQKRDQAGRPYWGVSNFWGMDEDGVSGKKDLSRLEWDGNEVFFEAECPAEIPEMLRHAIGVMKGWKRTLERAYPETPFVIFASYDDGSALINIPKGCFAVTFRFWAPRDGEPVLNFESFDDWDQPALVEVCNLPEA